MSTIDRASRRQLAAAIRRFTAGASTNEQLIQEIETLSDRDPGVGALVELLWSLYDDMSEHKANLTPAQRRILARCLLFLRSDIPYQYHRPGRVLSGVILGIDLVTMGLASFLHYRLTVGTAGTDLWPFKSAEELSTRFPQCHVRWKGGA